MLNRAKKPPTKINGRYMLQARFSGIISPKTGNNTRPTPSPYKEIIIFSRPCLNLNLLSKKENKMEPLDSPIKVI